MSDAMLWVLIIGIYVSVAVFVSPGVALLMAAFTLVHELRGDAP